MVLGLLQLMCLNIAWACSHKEQLHIVFTGNNHNVSHTQISSLGKLLFSNELIAKELHAFGIDINHSKGMITLDVDEQNQIQGRLEKIKDYLKQSDLKLIRTSHEQLLKSSN